MTGLFFFLGIVLMLVSSVCAIWLIVLSFRESVLWGLAVMFVPFAVVVFAIQHWDQCKKPFIGYLGGSVAAVMFIVLAVASGVGGQVAALDQAGLSDVSQPSAGVTNLSPSPPVVAPTPTPPRPRPQRYTPRRTRSVSRTTLTLANAGDHLGRVIRITARDGRVLKGYLVDAGSDRLVLEKDLSGGVFSFEIAHNDVKSLELVR